MKGGDRAGKLESRMEELDERERYELRRLRKAMGSSALNAESVGEVLPDAVVVSASADGRLPKSMVETTERAIGLSVAQDPAILSEALFPVIGQAIRKAVEHLVAEMLFKLNAGLEKGLSAKRLGWRIEALRSGIPYYEIVLKHTLDYRVDCAFLIHKKTGILLAESSQPGPSRVADKDLVASMLTVVRDYIKDSLSLDKAEAVDVLSAGDYSIFVEEGPLALVALVVRGSADPALRSRAQDALETIHTRLGPELRAFEGEVGPFEKARDFLSPCLVSVDREGAAKKPVYAIALLCLIAALGCFLIARGTIQAARDRALVAALDAEPGIVVVDSGRRGGLLRAKIMRSVQAREIAAIAAERGFDLGGTAFDVELYLSLGPVPQAAAAQGSAPAPLAAARGEAAAPAPAVSEASARPSPELEALASRLAARRMLFDRDSGLLVPGQESKIAELRLLARSFVELARKSGLSPRIEVVGHAAGRLRDGASETISAERARTAAQLLGSGDSLLAAALVERGAGVEEPVASEELADGAAQNRSASFRATYR